MADPRTSSPSAKKDVNLEEKCITASVNSLSPLGGENVVHKHEFSTGDSLYAHLQRFAGRYGVEQRGIERVPSDERSDSGMSKIGTMWFSANMAVSTFAVGAVAVPIFGLGFVDAALVIVLATMVGVLPVCFFSTLGMKFGLRQMVLSRFYFGYYGVKLGECLELPLILFTDDHLAAMMNVIACVGWSAVNSVVAAQLIHAANPAVPGWASILVIGLATLIVSLLGYRAIHNFERWSWVPCLAVFLIVLIQFARSGQFDSLLPLKSGKSELSAILSFASAVFGFSSGWCCFAADYTVYQPATRSRTPVFLWTFVGICVPLVFLELLGAAITTATVHNQEYHAAYHSSSVGGMLAHTLITPLGRFGEFCIVVLALSAISNSCPNIYSMSLTIQVLAQRTQQVPRFVWALLSTCAYLAIAMLSYDHFSTWLDSFLLAFSYWLAIYQAVSLIEHFVFRRGTRGYRPEEYTRPKLLPPGFAAVASSCCGVLGAILGMAQYWFSGPIAKLCGTDVGFEMAFIFTAVSFLSLRTLERCYFRR